jgi:hypothetical protein
MFASANTAQLKNGPVFSARSCKIKEVGQKQSIWVAGLKSPSVNRQ